MLRLANYFSFTFNGLQDRIWKAGVGVEPMAQAVQTPVPNPSGLAPQPYRAGEGVASRPPPGTSSLEVSGGLVARDFV